MGSISLIKIHKLNCCTPFIADRRRSIAEADKVPDVTNKEARASDLRDEAAAKADLLRRFREDKRVKRKRNPLDKM